MPLAINGMRLRRKNLTKMKRSGSLIIRISSSSAAEQCEQNRFLLEKVRKQKKQLASNPPICARTAVVEQGNTGFEPQSAQIAQVAHTGKNLNLQQPSITIITISSHRKECNVTALDQVATSRAHIHRTQALLVIFTKIFANSTSNWGTSVDSSV